MDKDKRGIRAHINACGIANLVERWDFRRQAMGNVGGNRHHRREQCRAWLLGRRHLRKIGAL